MQEGISVLMIEMGILHFLDKHIPSQHGGETDVV